MKYNLLMTELNKMFDDSRLEIIRKDDSESFLVNAKNAKRIFRKSGYEVVQTYSDPMTKRLVMIVRRRSSNFDKNMVKIYKNMSMD